MAISMELRTMEEQKEEQKNRRTDGRTEELIVIFYSIVT